MAAVVLPRRARRRRVVGFADEGPRDLPFEWRSLPDSRQDVLPPLHDHRAPEAETPAEPEQSAPEGVLRLRSSCGDIFEAPPHWLWSSKAVREMVEAGLDEEIPLPRASSNAVEIFLEHCQCFPGCPTGDSRARLSNVTNNVLDELLWLVRLLDCNHILHAGLMDMLVESDERLPCLSDDLLFTLVAVVLKLPVAEFPEGLPLPRMLRQLCTYRSPRISPGRILDLMQKFLALPREDIRAAAIEALQASQYLEAKLTLLQHREFSCRTRGLDFFNYQHDVDIVGGLVALAVHPSLFVREAAAKALGKAAPYGDQRALEVLIPMLADSAREVREAVVDAVRRVAVPDDPDTIAAVLPLASSDNWPVRGCALTVLVAIAPSDSERVTQLAKEMQSSGTTMGKFKATYLLDLMTPSPNEEKQENTVLGYSCGSVYKPRAGEAWCDAEEEDDDEY